MTETGLQEVSSSSAKIVTGVAPAAIESRTPIRILIVEDHGLDTALIVAELNHAAVDFTFALARNVAELERELEHEYDIIISDYDIGPITALDVLDSIAARGLDTPVIVVTGAIRDAAAAECLRRGATDYLLKDRLSRLPAAINQAIARYELELAYRAAHRRNLESEARFRRLAENARDLIVSATPKRLKYISPSAERILGYCPADFDADPDLFWRAMTAASQSTLRSALDRAVHGETDHQRTILEWVHRDGHAVFTEHETSPISWDGENVFGLDIVARDITDRKAAETALAEAETVFRALVDASQEMIYRSAVHKESGAETFDFISQNTVEVLGYEPGELMTGPFVMVDLIHPDDLDGYRRDTAASVLARDIGVRYFRLKCKDRSYRWLRDRFVPRFDALGVLSGFIGSARDISEERASREALVESQKMEAIGRLAAGLAHDFNNLLGLIIGYTDLLRAAVNPNDEALTWIDEVLDASTRATGLTKRLLAFSRRGTTNQQVIDVRERIATMDRLLRGLVGERVELVIDGDVGGTPVSIDPSHFDQIIINLATNARDAMPTGGSLTITVDRTSRRVSESGRVPVGPIGTDLVRIRVADTGEGIPANVRDRIFEPFFTTKGPDRGTGLGLATVYAVVTGFGGTITVASEAGRGSTFEILLPSAVMVAEDLPPAAGEPPARGTETVLFVDDQAGLRRLGRRVLTGLGYRVLAAGYGDEALHIANSTDHAIDILVTDIVMPGMDGIELARQLRALRPWIKVLFVSGYADEDTFRERGNMSDIVFLQKPYTHLELAMAVRRGLDDQA